ncbi:uncharacterized protein METZ01_LOCUS326221 [marine metagenome]|uniref:Uncharacterized protein n=1 Tax=marine metagenome TaxID=408172 RepID=A0A382PKK8_9ZZZZ
MNVEFLNFVAIRVVYSVNVSIRLVK